MLRAATFAAAAVAVAVAQGSNAYTVSDAGCAPNPAACRTLHGVGGLSGGGATSVLLPGYSDAARSDILDFLFKPDFGAALQILKVEIGGDAQSTDGAESSHMHTPWDENYERGYEWGLMVEAKKRNPDIKLYGLSWAFPQWVTCVPGSVYVNCTGQDPYPFPDQLATYITKWVAGAKTTYNLTIDYIGSWNERNYDKTYLKTLRKHLDDAGYSTTNIVAPDSGWGIADDILADPDLAAAVWGIGAHYPGMHSSSAAEQTGKPLWASEDDSTLNNAIGAGCWARLINRNYVLGNMTASINWNLVAAYTKGTNWWRAGLMNALSPWSGAFGAQLTDGSFTAGPMIWASAHTTQFTRAGWTYMLTAPAAGSGSGSLANGGTYVTLVDYTPGNAGDFTIVIEKMSRNHSSCVRPGLPDYPTSDETATFTLTGALARVSSLHLWSTHWAQYNGDVTHEFEKQADVPVVGGVFTLPITVDSIYTLTTMSGGGKGVPSAPPPTPFVFPTAHVDNFDACRVSSEANYFADQNGIFECFPAADPTHGIVMRQMIPLKPVTWGGDIRPHSLIGHRDGVNYSMVVDAYIEEPGASVLLGVRMQGTDNSGGIIWSIDTSGAWRVHRAIADVDDDGKAVITGTTTVNAGEWHTYRFDVNGSLANLWMDSVPVFSAFNVTAAGLTTTGHALIGTREYNHFTQYDNFQLYTSFVPPGGASLIVAGAPVGNVNCAADVGPQPGSTWSWSAAPGTMSGAFSLVANASLCLAAAAAPPNLLTLQPCDASSPYQTWAWTLDGIAPDGERKSQFKNAGLGACLDILGQVTDIGLQMDAWACNNGENQAFYWDFDQREIGNEATGTCVGVV